MKATSAKTISDNADRLDHGFFGPGSATWKVWTYPTSLIGFQRAVSIETFDPHLTAAVVDAGGVHSDIRGRFDRTAAYFALVAFGDGPSAVRASRELHRIHEFIIGTEPISGAPYAANDPASQLWIHMTAWHSVLKCYEVFGPGRLDPTEQLEYWQQCAIAGELQTFARSDVPTTRDDVREYFHEVRPRLALSSDGYELCRYFMHPPVRRDNAAFSSTFRTLSLATAATMPNWMRRMAGLRTGRAVDAAIIQSTRIGIRSALPHAVRIAFLERVAPSAVPYLQRALTESRSEPRTVTPLEAFGIVDAE